MGRGRKEGEGRWQMEARKEGRTRPRADREKAAR